MRLKQHVGRLLLSGWFLSLLPTLLIVALLPDGVVGQKYLLKVEPLHRVHDQIYFVDLNGDGVTEQIDAIGAKPLNNIHVTDNDFNVYEQWNLPHIFLNNISNLAFGDYDHDRNKEIYVFTVKGDSLFLNVNEFFDSTGLKFERVFVTTFRLVGGEPDGALRSCGMFDRNGDNKEEFYFSITSGFGLEPRLIYSFDLEKRSAATSPYTSININDARMQDIDGDKRPEIFGMISASGNHHFKTPFSDYSAWLMVFDDQLQFKFEPIEFSGFGNSIDTRAVCGNNHCKLAVTRRFYAAGNDNSGIQIYTSKGVLQHSVSATALGLPRHFDIEVFPYEGQDRIAFISNNIVLLDEDLTVVNQIQLDLPEERMTKVFDLDLDGQPELLIYSPSNHELTVLGPTLEVMYRVQVTLPNTSWLFSRQLRADGSQKVYFKAGDVGCFLQLEPRRCYILGYLIPPGIYLVFVGFIFAIRKINTVQIEKREQIKRNLLALQLKSIKGQLNPHFTFNALNSIAALLYIDDRKAAYDHLNNFTRLLRQILSDIDRTYRTLQEEIDFVKVYLDLEILRFGDKVRYNIETRDGVTGSEEVPILVLQTFAENAVKHGLMHRAKDGLLRIIAEKENGALKLIIEDNGIGRTKAAHVNNSTGMGLKITSEFYDILNQVGPHNISYKITDLVDQEGEPLGTRVEIWIK